MKRLLSRLVGRAVKSPRHTVRPVSRVRLRMDLLEGREIPSYFLPYIQAAIPNYDAGYPTTNRDAIPDAIVG